jgi:hypothetical protein
MAVHRSPLALLTLLLLLVGLAPVAHGQSATALLEFEIEDQFKRKHTHEEFVGHVVLLVGGGREGSKYTGAWGEAATRQLRDAPGFDDLRVLPYADTRGVPFFLKGMIRGYFPKEEEAWTLIDWKGRLAEAYELDPDEATLLLFGKDGQLVTRASGTELDAQVLERFVTTARAVLAGASTAPARGYSIPIVDLAAESDRQTIVDREPGQYLGHPTTVLLEDGRTMIAVYPQGHGRGAILMKRSGDAGRTWSERLATPASWETSLETPTIHRVITPDGTRRLLLFSGLFPIRRAYSDDDGSSWTELEPIGRYGGIVAMASVASLADGSLMALFHDDGRFLRNAGTAGPFHVYKVLSADGGLTWSQPRVIATHPSAHLCEPGLIRSPDGSTLAVLLRENSRQHNSFVIFSRDEGATWSAPRELPGSLTGDRHVGRYGPDGRLLISFRDTTLESPTHGDWVAWVGTWEDIVAGREGQYRVRLMDNLVDADTAYPGVEVTPEGTFVLTTYGHWLQGEEPFIVSVRVDLETLDSRLPE